MSELKEAYFRNVAKNLAASTVLYRVDSVVHVESEDDIWFWRQLLSVYRPAKYKFMPATKNERGNKTTGCTQCLKYRNYLSQKFFICIDSDLRFLLGEDLSASEGILQTYTYSWENHCAYADHLQQSFKEYMSEKMKFDFRVFLHKYSSIVYKPFLFMLYQERTGQTAFGRDSLKKCLSMQYQKGDELNNGKQVLGRLSGRLIAAIGSTMEKSDFNYDEESVRYASLGLQKENTYLYVRGHCLYDYLVLLGGKLCSATGVDFKQNILQSSLALGQYDEISRIEKDIHSLTALRTSC